MAAVFLKSELEIPQPINIIIGIPIYVLVNSKLLGLDIDHDILSIWPATKPKVQ